MEEELIGDLEEVGGIGISENEKINMLGYCGFVEFIIILPLQTALQKPRSGGREAWCKDIIKAFIRANS